MHQGCVAIISLAVCSASFLHARADVGCAPLILHVPKLKNGLCPDLLFLGQCPGQPSGTRRLTFHQIVLACDLVVSWASRFFYFVQAGDRGIKLSQAGTDKDTLAAVAMVMPEDEVLLGSERGKIVRLQASSIEVCTRLEELHVVCSACRPGPYGILVEQLAEGKFCW